MKKRYATMAAAVALTLLAGCEKKSSSKDEAPPPVTIQPAVNVNTVQVKRPDQFPLVAVSSQMVAGSMSVTGQVQPDVTRVIPVISLASGRIASIHAHIGDVVKKGQLLFTVQSNDIEQAFSDYRKALADEALSRTQLDRAKLLFSKGAISQGALEIAQDTEDKALVDVQAAKEHLSVLGVTDLGRPAGVVNVTAPASGVIIEQNVSQAAGVKSLDNSPNLFTIANIDDVWIVCDVYENNLPKLTVGQSAEIRFSAFPDRTVTGRISEIDPILDPNIRTAKVRIQVHNPGFMKIGMFVTAVFHSQSHTPQITVPSTAIVHLHDEDFVYIPAGSDSFTRTRVVGGAMLPGNQQIVESGLTAGQKVVVNGLELQTAVTQ